MIFGCNLSNLIPLKCISMNNQEWKVRPEIININSNKPSFYDVKINKCSGSCNDIYDPYAEMCIPDVITNLNLEVFNLMPRTNETRHIKFHETCNEDGMKINADANKKN